MMELKLPPPLQALIAALLMWGISTLAATSAINFAWQVPIAVVLVVVGFGIALGGTWSFHRAQTTVNPLRPENASHLVTSGIYRISRNPMYLGLLLVLTGLAVYLGLILNIVVLVVFVLYMTHFQIKPEERALSQLFGSEFEQYCSAVRRWM